MKVFFLLSRLVLMFLLLVGASHDLRAQEAPHRDRKQQGKETMPTDDAIHLTVQVSLGSPLFANVPVAVVNDESILLEDMKNAVAFSHREDSPAEAPLAGKMDFPALLKRLINIRLIAQEARNIGLDELPEIRKELDQFAETSLRQLFVKELIKDVQAGDDEVERAYRERIKEWKIKTLVFGKEDDAKAAKGEIRSGKSFEEVAERARQEGTAQGGVEAKFMKTGEFRTQVAEVMATMEVGAVSPIIPSGLGKHVGFLLVKLEDVRYPDNPDAREKARQQVLADKKRDVLSQYRQELHKKYVKIHKRRLRRLNYGAKKPGMEKLSKDKRVIAEIRGDKPITVGDLTEELMKKYYHGLKTAVESKRVDREKRHLLQDMLDKRLFKREALKRGIDRSPKYRAVVKEYETTVLFGAFLKKIVFPDIQVSTEEKKAYHRKHRADYTYPEMMKLSGLAFEKARDAERALAKLKKGADFKWIKEHAAGQLDEKKKGLQQLEGRVLTTENLPEETRRALAGAKAGDFRLATSPEGYHYVLAVENVIPPREQPFSQVESEVHKILVGEKLNQALEEWARQLRAASDVKVYLSASDR